MPKIAFISTSLGEQSRSRTALKAAFDHVSGSADTSWHDLRDMNAAPYSDGAGADDLKKILNDADAWVFGAPVHNWSPSGAAINFLAYALDRKTSTYKPFVVILGAGGGSSYLVDGLSKTVRYETQGVEIGAPLLAAGDEVNKETGEISEKMVDRINRKMDALLKFV